MPDTVIQTMQSDDPRIAEAWDRVFKIFCDQTADALRKTINVPQLRSPEVAQLATALAMAQKNFAPIPKNREVTVRSSKGDYKFKYATLDGILSATVPALAEQGLALVQTIIHDGDGNPGLETTLYHSSGEWLRSITPMFLTGREKDGRTMPPSNQELGSAQSYARRYGLSALLCVAADEDDDGNIADGNHIEGSRDVPYRGGTKGQANGGADFRPAGPRRFQGALETPPTHRNGVRQASANGARMAADEPESLERAGGRLKGQMINTPTAAANAVAQMAWIKDARKLIGDATTKATLSDWWRQNEEQRETAAAAIPVEFDKLIVLFDEKMTAVAQAGA